MHITTTYTDPELIRHLQAGELAIMRTDTVYGILALASSQKAVERVFDVKGRDSHKAFIVLVSSLAEIPGLTSEIANKYESLAQERPTSLIIPKTSQPAWLTRSGDSLAYRVPNSDGLRQLLSITGPLVAPSANPQGLPVARTVTQAIGYFKDQIDIYVDHGEVPAYIQPSRLLRIDGGMVVTLRS